MVRPKVFIYCGLLIFSSLVYSLKAQVVSLSGVVNSYYRVEAVYNENSANIDSVKLYDVTGLGKGDTVMIYQMKGAEVDPATGNYPSFLGSYAGRYEILLVNEVQLTNRLVIFTTNLSFYGPPNYSYRVSYTAEDTLQLIKVKSYRKASVNGVLTCKAWDGKTGGVLALIVSDTLWLNADIDVSGKGFRGAAGQSYPHGCSSDDVSLQQRNYSAASDSAGWKGEGIVHFMPSYAKGYGYLGSNSGGGNGQNSGGAGGSNGGQGGAGGKEWTNCAPGIQSESGKNLASYYDISNVTQKRIFFGGGGGGGTNTPPLVSSKGGNGGGVVLIMAGAIVGNGKAIRASGETPSACSGGAGGGGAGGAIILDITSYLGSLTAEAKGGNGGSTTHVSNTGAGGGGGGGFIWYSEPQSGSFTRNVSRGLKGSSVAGSTASDGANGSTRNNLIVQTRGWLFNVMPLDDTICAGTRPKEIRASYPKGGNGPGTYFYKWFKSLSKEGPYAEIAGATNVFYQPPVLDTTTYFKRLILSIAPGDTIRDTSLTYTVKVYPAITLNTIAASDTFCYGQDPGPLTGPWPGGGNGTYSIYWDNSLNPSFVSANLGISTTQNYNPPVLYQTNYFRRRIISGVCRDTSNTVTLTVLPLIGNNKIITSDTMVCFGRSPLISANQPNGGDGSYLYKWQYRTDSPSSQFQNAPGSSAQKNYVAQNLTDTIFLRRVVWSGADTVCKSISDTVRVRVTSPVTNNLISADQTLCEATSAQLLKGKYPRGGDIGNYTYYWEKSLNQTTWTTEKIQGNPLDTLYDPGIMSATAWYRRVVFSGLNNTCKDTSNVVKLTVQPKIQGNTIWIQHSGDLDTTQCYGSMLGLMRGSGPPALSGGDGSTYLYTWRISYPSWDSIGATRDFTYNQKLLTNVKFMRQVRSGKCVSFSDTASVTVLPSVTGNLLIPSDSICTGTSPGNLSASLPSGGDNSYRYKWQRNTGSGWNDIAGIVTSGYDPGPVSAETSFRRMVFSGPYDCCKDTSGATVIALHTLPRASLSFVSVFSTGVCEETPVRLQFSASTGSPPYQLYYSRGDSSFVATMSSKNQQFRDVPHPPYGTEQYHFVYKPDSLFDRYGCKADLLIGKDSVDVFKKPDIVLPQDTLKYCGKSLELDVDHDVGTGIWKINAVKPLGAESSITLSNPVLKNSLLTSSSADTAEWVKLFWVVDNHGCTDSLSRWYVLYRIPPHQILVSDTTLYYEFEYLLNAEAINGPTETGVWRYSEKSGKTELQIENTTSGQTMIRIPQDHFGDYLLSWTVNNHVCAAQSDSVHVVFSNIRGYNGFSPNGDEINDVFWVEGVENLESFEITIMNRWGEVVYNYSNKEESPSEWKGWDGKHYRTGKDVPEGIYYYIIKANGRIYNKNGKSGQYILLRR